MKKSLFFILSICVLLSCEKEVNIPIEFTEPKLVVNGLFNNDSLWEVEISASQYVYTMGLPPLVNDAQVTVRDAIGNSVLLSNQGDGIYTSSTEKPETGKIYTLEVSHDNYVNITASNELPNIVSIQQIDWQQQTIINGELYRKINITLQDSPQDDYYMVRIAATFWEEQWDTITGQWDSALVQWPLSFMTQSPAVENAGLKEEAPLIMFTDNLFNGSQYTIDLLLGEYFFSGEKESIETIYISTSSISQEYYWYQTSYQNYLNSQAGLFSQPVQVYTNIENGLGVFAGYSTRIDSIVVQ